MSISSLPKVAWQRLIDTMMDKLSAWKGRLMYKSGRLALIKSTLVTVSVHTAIGLELPAWVRNAMVEDNAQFLVDGHGFSARWEMHGCLEFCSTTTTWEA
jgi:hypothetical protein